MDPRRRRSSPADSFEEFQATALFCPRCGTAQPVREHLLLVLPDGELHEYLCVACGTQVGKRKTTGSAPLALLAGDPALHASGR